MGICFKFIITTVSDRQVIFFSEEGQAQSAHKHPWRPKFELRARRLRGWHPIHSTVTSSKPLNKLIQFKENHGNDDDLTLTFEIVAAERKKSSEWI